MTQPHKTKWRPASLPASTVPRSVGPARKGETAFPREVPAEALRPRSVPQVPRSMNIAIPVRVPAGSAPCLAAGFGSLAGPVRLRLATSTFRFPIGHPLKRTSSVVLSRFPPPGGFRFRRTLEGKWVRLWLAPLPRASSFRLPGPRFDRLPSEDFCRFSAGPPLEASSFPKAAPCDKRTMAPVVESRQTLNRGSGLWITGISGITWVKVASACQSPGLRP